MSKLEKIVKSHDWLFANQINHYCDDLVNYEDDAVLCKPDSIERCVKHFSRYLPDVYRHHVNATVHHIRSTLLTDCDVIEICGETFYIIEGLAE